MTGSRNPTSKAVLEVGVEPGTWVVLRLTVPGRVFSVRAMLGRDEPSMVVALEGLDVMLAPSKELETKVQEEICRASGV